MHILQLLPALEVGGVERGVLDITKGLIARGHRVSVISAGGPLVEPLERLGATHYQLPVDEKSFLTIRACMPAVARFIRDQQIDLVHARSRVPGWIGFAAARWTQRPFVTTAHGFYSPHWGSRVMVWGRFVIVPSEALARYLVERFGVSRERLRVIPRGVDLAEFAFQPARATREGPWRIGLFSRLSPLKGQEIAVRACEQLVRNGHAVTLCLAGDVPQSPARRHLEALVKTLKLEDSVEWLGIRHDLAALIASMDCVIAPSTYPESFGRSVIEAQAVGRPVIASRIGALAELIEDGHNGLLVPPKHPFALAEAIERLMQDAALRARCVKEGRTRVEARWTVDRMVDQTAAVYDECLAKPRIVVWKLSALGDIILATPSFRAVRRQFPSGHITLVVGRSAYEIVARCPYFDEIVIYDARGKDRGPWKHWALIARLRRRGVDLSIDLQNSRKTHAMAWLTGAAVRIGYHRKFGWLLNRGVRVPRVALAPIAHQHYLLMHAGLTPDGEALELWPSAFDEQEARHLLTSPKTSAKQFRIGIHPGGSGRWKTKRWDLQRWAQLCTELEKHGVELVVVGGPEEQALGEQLTQLTNAPLRIVIGKTSVMELACLIKQCDAFIAHDSSTLHLAAAMNTPTVALFGPTDPARHLPPAFNGQVIKKDVFCSPCYSPRCRTVTHACMVRISVEDVLRPVLAMLSDVEAGASR
ncbi:MAG: glycosyltransferase [Candidatus Omnitrophica bacterium]|nr:glycosyltransferase [Candidatus Omnitrophota bacterium]